MCTDRKEYCARRVGGGGSSGSAVWGRGDRRGQGRRGVLNVTAQTGSGPPPTTPGVPSTRGRLSTEQDLFDRRDAYDWHTWCPTGPRAQTEWVGLLGSETTFTGEQWKGCVLGPKGGRGGAARGPALGADGCQKTRTVQWNFLRLTVLRSFFDL